MAERIDMGPCSDHDPDAYASREAELASAWDDGWASGMVDAAYLQDGKHKPLTDNPYRATPEASHE